MVIGVYWATPRLMIALLKDDVYTGSILAVFTFSFFPVAWVLTMIPETYRRHGPGNRRLSD
jgi:hypothetical protein